VRQYIVNERGERTAVQLPIDEYEELLERLEDAAALQAADEALASIRAGEETVPWAEVRDKIGTEYEGG
jgi:PHD/YefM family antitoxin component YafN of YafNO toxin-antitoxin module